MLDGVGLRGALATAAGVAAFELIVGEELDVSAQRILGYLSAAYWRFTADAPRRALAPRVEEVLRRGLAAAPTASLKSAYFSTLRDVALTPPVASRPPSEAT